MDNENPKVRQSLLDELSDVNELLDGALVKARNLANINGIKSQDTEGGPEENEGEVSSRQSKPSNWDDLRNSVLEESIDAQEEDKVELANNTKQVRQVKPKNKKLRVDDNWEDDPF